MSTDRSQSWETLRAKRGVLRSLSAVVVLLALFAAAVGAGIADPVRSRLGLLAGLVLAIPAFLLYLRARTMSGPVAGAFAALPEARAKGRRA